MVALFAPFCSASQPQSVAGPLQLVLLAVEGEKSLGVVVGKAVIHLIKFICFIDENKMRAIIM